MVGSHMIGEPGSKLVATQSKASQTFFELLQVLVMKIDKDKYSSDQDRASYAENHLSRVKWQVYRPGWNSDPN